MELYSPEAGLKLGRVWKTVITIINDDGILKEFYDFILIFFFSILNYRPENFGQQDG